MLRKHWHNSRKLRDDFSPVKHAFDAVKSPGFKSCRPSGFEPHKREFYVNVAVIVAFQSQPNKMLPSFQMGITCFIRTPLNFHIWNFHIWNSSVWQTNACMHIWCSFQSTISDTLGVSGFIPLALSQCCPAQKWHPLPSQPTVNHNQGYDWIDRIKVCGTQTDVD